MRNSPFIGVKPLQDGKGTILIVHPLLKWLMDIFIDLSEILTIQHALWQDTVMNHLQLDLELKFLYSKTEFQPGRGCLNCQRPPTNTFIFLSVHAMVSYYFKKVFRETEMSDRSSADEPIKNQMATLWQLQSGFAKRKEDIGALITPSYWFYMEVSYLVLDLIHGNWEQTCTQFSGFCFKSKWLNH